MLHLDGSTLEGGGQLVRNALALSALTGRPVTINNIRGKRNGPRGLRRSHTAAILFLAEVCGGRIVGATVGSSQITFYPRDAKDPLPKDGMGEGGFPSIQQRRPQLRTFPLASPIQSEYTIRLTTPGSIFLIFQALYPYLVYAGASLQSNDEGSSSSSANRVIKLNITGGTNISFSPSYDYVSQVLIPNFATLGLPRLSVKLNRRGWSTGAVQIGSVSFEIEPLAISNVSGATTGILNTNEVGHDGMDCPKRGEIAGDPESESLRQTELSDIFPPRFPRISLKNFDSGFITQVDITVLAPDTTLHQAVVFNRSKEARQRTRKNGKHSQHGTKRFEKHHNKRTSLSEAEFDEEESEVLETSPPGAKGLYGSPGFQSIRGFLEDAAMKSVTRVLRVFPDNNNPRATNQPSLDETPVVKIHTTEPTYDLSHIYVLLVAHTSTGCRLGRGKLYSEYQSEEKNKECRGVKPVNPQKNMETLLEGMVDNCVASLMGEFSVLSDAGPTDVPRKGTKGCLDTFMRDQIVVFQALGELEEEIWENCNFGDQAEEQGLSLHTLTAMWVCERVLGVRV